MSGPTDVADDATASVELVLRPGVPQLLARDSCQAVLAAAVAAAGAPAGAVVSLILSDDAELAAARWRTVWN